MKIFYLKDYTLVSDEVRQYLSGQRWYLKDEEGLRYFGFWSREDAERAIYEMD